VYFLPHVLLALEGAIEYSVKLKREAGRRLIAPSFKHQELEYVNMQMNESK
jgi:hypothetical protein